MAHTSRPDKTRNLPNLDLKPGYKDLGVLAALDLRTVGGLKEQLDRFLQIVPGSLDRIALACDINFGAKANVAIAFALDNRGELLYVLHYTPC
jgi:hypothetical protein